MADEQPQLDQLTETETELSDMWSSDNLLQEIAEPEQQEEDIEPEQQEEEDIEPEQQQQEDIEPEQQQNEVIEPEQQQEDIEPEQQKEEDIEPEQQKEEDIEPEQQQEEDIQLEQQQEDIESEQQEEDIEPEQQQEDIEPEQQEEDVEPVQHEEDMESEQKNIESEQQEEDIELEQEEDIDPEDEDAGNSHSGSFVKSSFQTARDETQGSDVFSRLSSHMTGTHKYGGRRAMSVVHSSRLRTSSVYGGGASRTRTWLRISEDTPGIQGDPHANQSIARSAHGRDRRGNMGTSERFRPVTSSGVFRSTRELAHANARAHTAAPEQASTSGGGSRRGGFGGTASRFAVRNAAGQYRSRRDIEDTANRGANDEGRVYSSFKSASASSGRKGHGFGGSVSRFREQTANGLFVSTRARESAAADGTSKRDGAPTEELAPTYSSFARSSAKQRSSSHMGGATRRFVPEQRNGGLVTPGPGAFELQPTNAKGYFGPVDTGFTQPISMMA